MKKMKSLVLIFLFLLVIPVVFAQEECSDFVKGSAGWYDCMYSAISDNLATATNNMQQANSNLQQANNNLQLVTFFYGLTVVVLVITLIIILKKGGRWS